MKYELTNRNPNLPSVQYSNAPIKTQRAPSPAAGSYLVILLLFFSCQLQAQEYRDTESKNIRMDPEWTLTYETGEYAWASDMVADKAGNIYSTGFFQKNLKAGNDSFSPGTTCYARCPDTFVLMKHNARGNLAWIRYGIGSARPFRVAVDGKGFIYTVGSAFDKELYFTSSDSSKTRLERPDYSSGIFVCKYDANGKLIRTKFITEHLTETPGDFVLDANNNIYIAGSYDFRANENRAQVRKRYLLLKLDENWELVWKHVGDTIGQSAITALCLDPSGNLYVTGYYNYYLDIGDKALNKHNAAPFQNDPNIFVAKYNDKGQCAWAIDSIGANSLGTGKSMVRDKKGNLYVAANTGRSSVYFASISADGKPRWCRTIQGKNPVDNTRLLIDSKDNIYMCGEGYGAVFGSGGSESYSFKSKGGMDFYFAKYNSKGECLWLKAGGGTGMDYCKSIALVKKELVAFGWFGKELIFKDSVIMNKSEHTFWLAKFRTP